MSTSLIVYLQSSGKISASVMYSSKERQEEIAVSLHSLSQSRITNTTPIYPSPPNSPPQATSNISKVRKEFKDEQISSESVSSVLPTPSTSPLRNVTNLISQEEEPAENKNQLKASALKTLLGLDEWQCGYPTLQNTPCAVRILKKNQSRVNSQIELMITLTVISGTQAGT